MVAPTMGAALAAGGKAVAGSAWLAPVGMLVVVVRGALFLPAAGFAGWLVARGATAGILSGGLSRREAIHGALGAATAPRLLAILAGLWLGAVLLGAALRVAYLAGALPTLGRELANGSGRPPEFAAGVAWRFPRVTGTALLALLLEIIGSGFALTAALGALMVSLHASRLAAPLLSAVLVALVLTLALFVLLAAPVVGDAAMARAALRNESPARAVASAVLRFGRRPAAFFLAALLVGLFGFMMSGSLRAVTSLVMGAAHGRNAFILLGPQLMAAALAALVAALVELWRFATLAVLACGE